MANEETKGKETEMPEDSGGPGNGPGRGRIRDKIKSPRKNRLYQKIRDSKDLTDEELDEFLRDTYEALEDLHEISVYLVILLQLNKFLVEKLKNAGIDACGCARNGCGEKTHS